MAINRPEITEKVFNRLRTPATDFTSPVIAGYSATIEGNNVLAFNADEAKKRWAQADQLAKWSGTFEIAYTTQGPNKDWVDAVANSIKNTLGIDAAGKPFALFSDMRTQIEEGVLVAAAMSVWGADYPSQYNFLFPLYSTGAGENTEKYSNAEFDRLLDEGVSAPDLAAATAKFQQAQRILLADLPAVPLWYNNATGGHSTKVGNVAFGWDGIPLYYAITKP
jgi:oligopeptide transport system substrate-binding protein